MLQDCLSGKYTSDDIIKVLDDAGLRGLGGAGFPSGRKWRLVREQPEPKLMAVNGDEGEPGTFKDRWFLETDPHRFLEGMLIAAWAVGVEDIYVYIRDEYPAARHIVEHELARLEQRGAGRARPCAHEARRRRLYLRRRIRRCWSRSRESAACRATSRPSPPRSVCSAARPCATTSRPSGGCAIWWRRAHTGSPARDGTAAKGYVASRSPAACATPGVKIAPAGISVRELIDEYCGGMTPGHSFKGYLPGGASGGILPARLGDLPLDFGTLEQHGALIGSAAVVVLSNEDSAADVALNLMRFFEDESCGQCTPCRAGCEKAVKLMEHKTWDKPLLEELSKTMMDASICGLGQAAPNGLLSVFRYFPDDQPKG